MRGARNSELIHPLFARYHQSSLGSECSQCFGDFWDETLIEHSQKILLRSCGIGQRSQDIENRAVGDGFANRHDVFHHGMMVFGKNEAKTGAFEHLHLLLSAKIQIDPESLEHICAAAFAGNAAIAVLRHVAAKSRQEKRHRAGDIEGTALVTSRADHIDQFILEFLGDRKLDGHRAHYLRRFGDILGTLSLFVELYQKLSRFLRR